MGNEGRHILNRLRKHRRLMGYSQNDVALLLGLESKSEISRWENGVMLPSIINLYKLSIIYRTLSDELYRDIYLDLRDELKEIEQKLTHQKRLLKNEKIS